MNNRNVFNEVIKAEDTTASALSILVFALKIYFVERNNIKLNSSVIIKTETKEIINIFP
jgi:hypothetical protein